MKGTRRGPALRDRLVLLPFVCREFGYESVAQMLDLLREVRPDFEVTEGSGFAQALRLMAPPATPRVSERELRRYDANIAGLGERLRMTRGSGRSWKPHQYLALLFAERYLDRWFTDADALCRDLNRAKSLGPGPARSVPDYRPDDLRVVAIQSATGSGKTLVMHGNLLQYRRYLRSTNGRLNNTILLTPNEQMSEQHERDFRASGIAARQFSPAAPPALDATVEILDLNKLAERSGVKRVAVRDFGDDNLVLVDEGHLGASGRVWRQRREELARGGFTLEYSATFNQVVRQDDDLRDSYARSLLFDYSYRQFHADGYGKDYTISNLPAGMEDANSDRYLLGCLLTFYQQCRLFRDRGPHWREFHPARPLWVFLGKTVQGSSRTDREARSDVVRIVEFLGRVLARGDAIRPMLESLLSGDSGLRDPSGGGDYFGSRFRHLAGEDAGALYADLCETLFHGPGRLRVVYLATGDGELHLRTADHDPFGVVNVGDSAALYRLLAQQASPDFDLERNAGFAERLFRQVDRPDSTVTVVVGARRFIAGWNSWRVSTMGLMHVGVREGPEIIQMFGRGVRLKGWRLSLKRHRESGAPVPTDGEALAELETLHIFGLRANYMEAFREIVQEEGIVPEPTPLPVTWNFARRTDLKMVRIRADRDYAFSAERPRLPGPAAAGRPFVEMDLYSQPQSTESPGAVPEEVAPPRDRHSVRLAPEYSGFFRRLRIYDELLARKLRRGWHNLLIDRRTVDALLDDNEWYDLRMPEARVRADGFAGVRRLEDLAISLLEEYAESFWRKCRRAWEHERLQVVELDADDPNHLREYRLSVDARETELVEDVRRLSEGVASARVPGLFQLMAREHAYQPLLYANEKCRVTVQPAPLSRSERDVVLSLVGIARQQPACLQGRELFLIRNLTRGRGVSFFDDFSYYPDFILWLKNDADQHVVFLDPKGLARYGRRERKKVQLHTEIRRVEEQIRTTDPTLFLHSYVLSVTPPEQIGEEGISRAEWEAKGVFFLSRPDCLGSVITHALDSRGEAAASQA